MNNEFNVKIKVESINKPCRAGVKVGDTYYIKNNNGALIMDSFDGCCPELFNTIFPNAMTLAHGGKLPWEDEKGRARSVCPDSVCCVKVVLSRE